MFPIDVHSLLLVAAGVDEDFQVPGSAAELCEWKHTIRVNSYSLTHVTLDPYITFMCFLLRSNSSKSALALFCPKYSQHQLPPPREEVM